MKYFKNRKLEFDILTIFLLLLSITSAIIIRFTYDKYFESVLRHSKATIDQVSVLITEQIDCLLRDLEKIPQTTTGVFARSPNISSDNTLLIDHFLDQVRYRNKLYGCYAGDRNGNYMFAFNVAATGKSAFPQTMPPDTAFILTLVDVSKSQTPVEEWRYYNKNMEMISSETLPWRKYDPRIRPWYTGPAKTGKLYWTDIYTFFYKQVPGISVSKPIYNQSKELLGVVAANLTLDAFSNFLINHKISEHGHAFILNAAGEVIIPPQAPDPVSEKIIPIAIAQLARDKTSDMIIDLDKEKYLVSLKNFTVTIERDWQVVIIAPFLDFFSGAITTQHKAVMISICIMILSGILCIYFSKRISKPIVILADEINKIKQLDLDSRVHIKSNIKEINLLDSSIDTMRNALRSFSRYVPKEIVKKLMVKGQENVLGGEKREITLFFSDVAGFTTIAESLSLDALNPLLAEYFDGVSKIILKNYGTIDKYIGDSIMAFWNAPDEMFDHTYKTCTAALECQTFITAFNQRQKEKGLPELKTRIGINEGIVIAGNIGTAERMNYTVIGDVVNTAERLHQINKVYHTKIIIGEEVVTKIGDRFLIRPLDFAEVKGRKGKIKIYELIATKEGAKPEEIELAKAFSKAYELFHRGNLPESKVIFEEIHRKFPDDYPTQMYLEQLHKI